MATTNMLQQGQTMPPNAVAPGQQPAFFQAMEDAPIPTIKQSIAMTSYRGSKTLMSGGFMDFKRRGLPGRSGRYTYFNKAGNLTTPGSGQYFGGQLFGGKGLGRMGRRAQRLAANPTKTPMLKAARMNNLSIHGLGGSYHSLSVFSGKVGTYSPMQGAAMIGRTAVGRGFAAMIGMSVPAVGAGDAAQSTFGPGLLSYMSTMSKSYKLESKAAARGSGLFGGRARSIAKMDRSIHALGSMNGLSASLIDDALLTGKAGVRGNLYASVAAGTATSGILGYSAGVMGAGGQGGLFGNAATQSARAEASFAQKFAKLNLGTEAEGIAKLRSTFGKSFIKEIGGVSQAAKFGPSFLAMRGITTALPVLNVLGMASILYDIGKFAGKGINKGIDLVKDAGKSLQGTIAKPLFGMGYKDTEAAATSRARGVMAIQNSQLNARSALGSEAGMLAAHFG
jgi:hypothetical protein